MVGSAHLTLSPIRFTAQFDFAFQIDIRTSKCIRHRWCSRWVDLRFVLDVVTCAEMSPSRLPNDAVCIYFADLFGNIFSTKVRDVKL